MRNRVLSAAFAAFMAASLLHGAPAQAATDKVTINTIGTKTAPYKKTVTIKPSVKVSGRFKVDSKTLTANKGKKRIATNKTSIKLKAGTYRVKQTVKFRAYRDASKAFTFARAGDRITANYQTTKPYFNNGCKIRNYDEVARTVILDCAVVYEDSKDVTRRAGTATMTAAWDPEADEFDIPGIYTGAPSSYYYPVGSVIYPAYIKTDNDLVGEKVQRTYGKNRVKSRLQTLVVKQGKKPRTCATKADLKSVKVSQSTRNGDSKATVAKKLRSSGKKIPDGHYDYGYVIEYRNYKPCKKGDQVSVGFYEGRAYEKSYYAW